MHLRNNLYGFFSSFSKNVTVNTSANIEQDVGALSSLV